MYDTLSDAAKSIPVGSREPFQALIHDATDTRRPYWFDIVRNDADALIVTRQWQPSVRRDLTDFRNTQPSK